MGAPRLRLRPMSAEEEEVLGEKLADKGQPTRIFERYRLIRCLQEGMNAAEAARAVGARRSTGCTASTPRGSRPSARVLAAQAGPSSSTASRYGRSSG